MLTKKSSIAVIGLGYVGLPLALLASQKGYDVTGIDISEDKINTLNKGRSYIDDLTDNQISSAKIIFTTRIEPVQLADIVLVCVPTPVDSNKLPDLTPLTSALASISPYLKNGALIIIESTINPGVCDEVVIPLLEKGTGKVIGQDIHIAHCPERINPGDKKWNVSNISRVLGSNSTEGMNLAYEFYSSIIDAEIKTMDNLKEAEAVKVVENSFRDINIAFVNELAMSFHKLGINLINVLDGAATKPFAFMKHSPGIGVGGHCIPVDPYYLIEYARGQGFEHRFLTLARTINEGMPAFTLSLVEEAEKKLNTRIKSVALLGISYKRDVADKRESPSIVLLSLLKEKGYEVKTYDPLLKDESTANNYADAIKDVDCIILATPHSELLKQIDPSKLAKNNVKVFIDGQNALKEQANTLIGHKIYYSSIGT